MIQLPRRLQVGAEGLFDDHSSSRLAVHFLGRQPSRCDTLDDRAVEIRRRRQIKDSPGQYPAAAIEAIDEFFQAFITVGLVVATANVISVEANSSQTAWSLSPVRENSCTASRILSRKASWVISLRA